MISRALTEAKEKATFAANEFNEVFRLTFHREDADIQLSLHDLHLAYESIKRNCVDENEFTTKDRVLLTLIKNQLKEESRASITSIKGNYYTWIIIIISSLILTGIICALYTQVDQTLIYIGDDHIPYQCSDIPGDFNLKTYNLDCVIDDRTPCYVGIIIKKPIPLPRKNIILNSIKQSRVRYCEGSTGIIYAYRSFSNDEFNIYSLIQSQNTTILNIPYTIYYDNVNLIKPVICSEFMIEQIQTNELSYLNKNSLEPNYRICTRRWVDDVFVILVACVNYSLSSIPIIVSIIWLYKTYTIRKDYIYWTKNIDSDQRDRGLTVKLRNRSSAISTNKPTVEVVGSDLMDA